MRNLVRSTILCALASAIGADAFAQCGTIPIVSPLNGSTGVQLDAQETVTVKWQAVSGATSYDVFFGTPAAQACIGSPQATVTDTQWSPPPGSVARGQIYEWRVRANGTACGVQPTSTCSTFATANCPTSAPTLTAPANNSEVDFGSVSLQWTNVPNAIKYEIYIGIDGGPMALAADTPLTQYQLVVGPGRTVEWKVVARAGTCNPLASSHFFFETDCPTGGPTLVSPASGAVFAAGTQVILDWNARAGASKYDVLVSPAGENDFEKIAEDVTTTSFAHTFAEGNWEWEVAAKFDSDCAPVFSAHRTFSVGEVCDNEAPSQISPLRGVTLRSPVTFQWTNVGADLYRLFVQKSGENNPTLLTSTTQRTFSANLEPGSYDWSVVAVFEGCADLNSGERTLVVEENDGCPSDPGKASLLAPNANATNLTSPLTFSWKEVADATAYRVLASFNNKDFVSLGTTEKTSLTADVPAGAGLWLVQTFFGEDCPTTLSERRAFQVSAGAQCGDTPPTLTFPPNGATHVESPVELKWSAVADAVSYHLFVAPGDNEFSFYGETDGLSLRRFVPDGSVRWFVVARFAACPDVRSSVGTFQVGGTECDDAEIDLKTPEDGATTSSPVRLSWSGVGGAEFYRLWVAIDDAPPAVIARTAANVTEVTLPLPAGEIRWYVDAPRGDCPPAVSDVGHFEVSEKTNCASNATPTLVSPVGSANNPANATNPVTLSWNPTPNAIAYRVWIAGGDGAFEDVELTRETHAEIDLDPGTYRWFLQALFDGCDPRESPLAFFAVNATQPRCPTATPTILTPGNGSVPDADVTISWTEIDKAEKYRLLASRNGEAPILLGTTSDTSLDRVLPPGHYEIAVQAVFEECPSTTSERISFTVAESQDCSGEAAELISPANGATNVDPRVTLVWGPVSGAVKYVVFAQLNDGAPTQIAVTDDTQVTHSAPSGRITWWVLTFFRGCDPEESEHFVFNVPNEQADCNTRKPILFLPADGPPVSANVHFAWSSVPNATGYNIWVAQGSPAFSIVATTTDTEAEVELPPGTYSWFAEATFDECRPRASAISEFTVGEDVPCTRPSRPRAQVVGQAHSGTRYRLRWTPLANVGFYEVQESTSHDFANAQTFTTENTSHPFMHEVNGAPVQYLYRVRGVSDCSDERGPYSEVVGAFVVEQQTNNASAEVGSEDVVVQTIFLPGSTTPLNFTATSDKPWITITPSTGILPIEGLTLTITGNASALDLGTNTASILINYSGGSAKGVQSHGTTVTTVPISVSLVTPVTPTGKSTPPPDSLIFPVVGHAAGANDSLFESDIRVTNLTAQTIKYQLNFTPSGLDGTQNGSSSTVEIAPNQTLAYDDIVASLFGTGTVSSATGTLEVRPLTTSSTPTGGFFSSVAQTAIKALNTAASSRTYNFTPNGTFGQFIPAIRFDEFVGKALSGQPPSILSLQQVAQSAAFRANFGFAEGSGQPADLLVRVYDIAGALLATIPVSLQAGEHKQLNGLLAVNGINDLSDGRVEVEVVGGNGKVTAYVSEVDNLTNDPLLVSAIPKGATTSNRYAVPGVAYIDNGFAFWVTDLRVFNAGSTSTPATLTFYPQGNPAGAVTRQIALDAGEIEVIDNVIGDLFAQPNGMGGSLVITTPTNTQLTATARTYNQTSNGTYGQYIPGVTPAQSVGVADRALQILQLEQSSRFRTNIGVNETTGQAARVEVTLIVPDSLASPVVTLDLAANEFRQFSLADFALGDAIYNARVSVKVVSGAGRVTAYGSAIDSITQDPTYVPAQ